MNVNEVVTEKTSEKKEVKKQKNNEVKPNNSDENEEADALLIPNNKKKKETKKEDVDIDDENYPYINSSFTSISSAKIVENIDDNITTELVTKDEKGKIIVPNNYIITDENNNIISNEVDESKEETNTQVLEKKISNEEKEALLKKKSELDKRIHDLLELNSDSPAIEESPVRNKKKHKKINYSGKPEIINNINVYKLISGKNKSWPQAICYDDDDNLWVLDGQICRVCCIDKEGKEVISFGFKGSKKQEFGMPVSLAVFKNYVLVGDRQKNCIQVFDKNGDWVNSIQSDLNVGLRIVNPVSICVRGNEIWVGDARTKRILCFDQNLSFLGSFSSTNEIKIDSISAISTDEEYIYVLEEDGNLIKFTTMGNYISTISTQSKYATGLFIDANTNSWITDSESGKAVCYSYDGNILVSFNKDSLKDLLPHNSRFAPSSLAIDSKGRIAIADTYSKQIKILVIK